MSKLKTRRVEAIKIRDRGQVTIPKKTLEALKLSDGDFIDIVVSKAR